LDTIWVTVDRLIHDLGAVRSVMDEVEAIPEASTAPSAEDLRVAMNEATDAISRLFSDTQDSAVEAAWRAMAHAQDAARGARAIVASARGARDANEAMAERARAQSMRANQQREWLERSWRQRDAPRPARPPGTDPDDGGGR